MHSVTHYSDSHLMEMIRGDQVFVVEEVCSGSGISQEIALGAQRFGRNYTVHPLDLGKNFVPHGDMNSLYRLTGLDSDSVANYIYEVLQHED